VRLATPEIKEKLENYAKGLEEKFGCSVHLPHRDTDQDQSGLDICLQNAHAISASDEIHIFYDSKSSGIHFDMGVAFTMDIVCGNTKKIVIVENEGIIEGKSFPRFLDEWSSFRKVNQIYDGSGNGTY